MKQHSLLFVLLAATLWGTTGTASFALQTDLSPFVIGAITMGGGGLILLIFGGKKSLAIWRDGGVRPWVIAGSVGALIYPLAFYTGMAEAGISLGNVLALGLGPLVAALAEWIWDSSAPRGWWWAASTGALVGIALMSTSQVTLGEGREGNLGWGITAAVIAGIAYGGYTYAFSRILKAGHDPVPSAGALFGGASPFLLLIALSQGPLVVSSALNAGLLVYLILGPMVIAYIAIGRALRTLTASVVTMVSLWEPLVASGLAFGLVGERVGLSGALGIALIVMSLILLARGETTRP